MSKIEFLGAPAASLPVTWGLNFAEELAGRVVKKKDSVLPVSARRKMIQHLWLMRHDR